MKSSSAMKVAAFAVVVSVCGGAAAQAEQYRVVASDTGTICQTGPKSEPVVIEGPDDVMLGVAEGDTLNRAICVGEGSRSNLHVQWKAAGAAKSTGNLGHGCAEILGASEVKVRAVNTDFVESATYYTCGEEPPPPAQ